MIDDFRGEYAYLSNFYRAPMRWGGKVVPTAEHAYQIVKCTYGISIQEVDDSLSAIWSVESPTEAKKIGRNALILVDEWEKAKVQAMRTVLRRKFDTHAPLCSKLVGTSPQELIEGNTWGDREWGKVDSVGKNMLGCLLMELRGYYIGKQYETR